MINVLLSTARSGSTWYGAVLSKKYDAVWLNELFHTDHKEYHRVNLLDVVKNFSGTSKNCVIKIFPNHLFKNNILERFVVSPNINVEILVRRNYSEQIKSLYVAEEYESDINAQGITDQYTWQKNFNTAFTIEKINLDKLETISRRLKKELVCLGNLYKEHNFKLTYFEDIKDSYCDLDLPVGKLHRPVIWEEPFPHISFDTESLFQ